MSILSVDNISPIGSGTSVTINSAATLVLTNANSTGVVTATSFVGSGANLTGVLSNIVEDTSPQLGGTLDTNNQDITFNGAQNVSWDSSAADLIFNDYAKINLGTDKDFKMYQAGNNTILQSDNTSGGVYLQGALIQIGSETGEVGVKFVKDGAAELYFNNSKKYETTGDGAKVTGELDVFKSGVGDIFHVQGNGTGAVVAKIENAYNSDNDRFAILELKSGKGSIRFNSNGDSNEGAITYNMADNTMVFGVNNASEKLRIQSGGGISFNGDTAAANALDDYEEGSWTPALTGGFFSGATYNIQNGTYVKIGGVVHAFFYIQFNAMTTSGGELRINSPFTMLTGTNHKGSGVISYEDLSNASSSGTFSVYQRDSTSLKFFAGGSTALSCTAHTSQANKYFIGYFTVRTP